MSLKSLAKRLLPPLLTSAIRKVVHRVRPPDNRLTLAPDGWATRLPPRLDDGYNSARVIEAERAGWEPFKAYLEENPSQVVDLRAADPADHDLVEEHNLYVTFAYVLALAASGKRSIRVLDYGGSLGYYYWIARAALRGVEIDYHCKELPAMVEAGRAINPQVTWHTDDSCLDERYDVVMLSALLQYFPDWREFISRAAAASDPYLYLARVSTVTHVPGYVARQQLHGAAMLHQQLNRQDVLKAAADAGMDIRREFWLGQHLHVHDAPEQPAYRGWLLEKRGTRPGS
jgi:putative methyltransferase (TIGR04325 family)